MSYTAKQKKVMTAAFQRAWRTLLEEERITAKNIERIPTMLLVAIVDAAQTGEQDELLLAQAAVHKIVVDEHGRPEQAWRKSSIPKRLH
jgi:hypothetical protein